MSADFAALRPELEWLLADFAERVPHLRGVVLLSSDGLEKASHALREEDAEKLAALSGSWLSLARGVGTTFDHSDLVRQAMVELADSILLVTPAGSNSALAVLVGRNAEVHTVSYEMGALVAGVERLLATPPRSASSDVDQ